MPLWKLAGKHVAGGNTPARKQGKFPLTGHTRMNPVYVDHREKKGRVDAVHRKKTRSMDQRVLVHREPRSRPQPGSEAQ